MPGVYMYRLRDDNSVIYVGMIGEKGRKNICDFEALEKRHKEHMTYSADSVYKTGYKQEQLLLIYTENLNQTEAEILETVLISKYKPKVNKRKKYSGECRFIDEKDFIWKEFEFSKINENVYSKRGGSCGKTLGRILTKNEVLKLLNGIDNVSPKPERDRALIELFLKTPIRESDVKHIKWSDLIPSSNGIWIERLNHHIVLDKELWADLNKYIQTKKDTLKDPRGKLFDISEKGIQYMVRNAGERVMIDNCTVSSLKKTYGGLK